MKGAVMSQNAKMLEVDQFNSADEADDLNIDNTDYGFIVSADGELKTFFCPDNPDGYPPKAVQKIFKIFKITDLREIIPQSTMIH
jgi:hypothetical protein